MPSTVEIDNSHIEESAMSSKYVVIRRLAGTSETEIYGLSLLMVRAVVDSANERAAQVLARLIDVDHE